LTAAAPLLPCAVSALLLSTDFRATLMPGLLLMLGCDGLSKVFFGFALLALLLLLLPNQDLPISNKHAKFIKRIASVS
jgi:hypothetical protein